MRMCFAFARFLGPIAAGLLLLAALAFSGSLIHDERDEDAQMQKEWSEMFKPEGGDHGR